MANEEVNLAEEVSAVARRHFGHDISYEDALAHIRAIKVILAADGISEAEAWALRKGLQDIGVPQALQDEAERFDPTGVKLEDLLAKVPKGSQRARELLRGAIRVSSADGYSAHERQKVMEAAWLLGIEPKMSPRSKGKKSNELPGHQPAIKAFAGAAPGRVIWREPRRSGSARRG